MDTSKVELFAAIRHDARRGASIRALAKRYRVHRRTGRQALTARAPAPRKPPVRRATRLEPFKPAIDQMLRADLDAPRKQRHTVRRILARLVDEQHAAGLSYSTVRDYVARRRGELAAETGRGGRRGSSPRRPSRAPRPRSTSATCGCGWAGS